MWEYYDEGSAIDAVIWIVLVVGSGLVLLYYIWEYFDKRNNPEKYNDIENFDWKKGLEEE